MSQFWRRPAACSSLLRSAHHIAARPLHFLSHDAASISSKPSAWEPTSFFQSFPVSKVGASRALGTTAAASEPDYDPTEARTPPSEKIHKLVDEISSLTLLEVSDLTTLLKKKLGLPAGMGMMPMGMGMMPGMAGTTAAGAAAQAAEEVKPEKTAFDVKLEKFEAASKIKIIKEVRTFTALGLKEAKELVEKTPALLKQGVSKEEAEQIIEKLKAVGGTAIME